MLSMRARVLFFALLSLLSFGMSAPVMAQGSFSSQAVTTSTTQPAAPAFSPAGGTYVGVQMVTITGSTTGATIYYTTDGSTPTVNSLVYSQPLPVNESLTINAIAVAGGGNPSATSTAAYTIKNVNGIISSVAGSADGIHGGNPGGPTPSEIEYGGGVAVDANGNVYFSDNVSSILKLTPAGTISTVAGNGTPGYSGDGGPATAAKLSRPQGLSIDTNGNLYIADELNSVIRKVTPAGVISTVAGNGTAGYSGDGGAATSAELSYPTDVVVDKNGNLYLADPGNNRIRKVTPAGVISTLAGNGTGGYSGDGGAATSAEISLPLGVAFDSAGNLYIADYSNSRIRKVTPAGVISTVAGNGTSGYSGDGGAATSAEINFPFGGVAVDLIGNLYISDTENNLVRKVTPNGVISTVAGNGTWGYSGDGGPAVNAELFAPAAITVDPNGNLYFVDDLDLIRKVTFTSADQPIGNLDEAVDSLSELPTVSQNDSVYISGWAADPVDGAPLSHVKVYIDGASVGTPALGIARPDVAAAYNNPAYANSGYTLSYPASSLSVGSHTVKVSATDSAGNTSWFEALTVNVVAGYKPPTGNFDLAVDNVTATEPVNQSDILYTQGWAGDYQTNGAVATVSIVIDGTTVGNATLGQSRPDVAAYFNNPAWANTGWVYSMSAASLSAGNHIITAIATDHTGLVSWLNTLTLTVVAPVTAPAAPPVANAGADRQVAVGAIVQLDGSASTDTSGNLLTYQWTLLSAPTGSSAALSNGTAVRPTITVDLPGTYIAQLVVNDGTGSSAPSQVIVSTVAIPPTANAGAAQHIAVGAPVTLDGSASTDPNGQPLTYAWSLTAAPSGSTATLNGGSTATPTFTADLAGSYVAQLIVSDSNYSSAPATVLIATGTLPPIAKTGATASVPVGTLAGLDGSASSDPQGLKLTYRWSLLSVPANSSAVLSHATTAKPAFTVDQPGLYVAQLIVNDGVQSSAPVTQVVYGLFPPAISVSLTNPGLLTYAATNGGVHISNPASAAEVGSCAGQTVEISLQNASLGDLSTAASDPATSVCIPVGLQDAPFTLTSNSLTGSTTVSGFAPTFQPGNTGFSVNARQMSLAFDTTSIGQGRVANGTVTLTNPAPAGGTTVTVASTQTGIASVSAATIQLAAGATAGTFQVNGLAPGTTSVSVGAAQAGYGSQSASITVFSPAVTLTIPHSLSVGPGAAQPFPVSIGAAAKSDVTVTLATSGGPGTATVSPSTVTIPAGATTPVTEPTFTGGTVGNVTATASATGYAPDIETETVSVALALTPPSVSFEATTATTYTVSASSIAPSGGFTVKLSVADTTVATVPATVLIPAGASSVAFQVTGVAAGNTTLTASGANGFTSGTASVSVFPAPTMTLGCDGTLGYNTVGNGCRVYLSAPAPPAGVSVTLTSSDATKVTLSNSQSSTGTKTQVVNIPGGSQYSSYAYPAALVGTGTVTVTASASGYNSATSSINLEPSGFVLQAGGNPVAGSSPSGISINFYSLNPTTLTPDYSTSNTLRAGASSITLGLTDDNTKVGTLGATSFTLGVGNQSAQTTFTPLSPGTANIALTGQPAAGYTQPSSGNVTGQYVVSAATMTLGCDGTLGYNTVGNGCRVYLSAPAPPAGVSVTLTSSDATKVTLSNSQSSTGTKTQVVNIPGGSQYSSYASYAYPAALVGTGTVTVTASASGYNSATSSINLEPSGFVLQAGGNPVAGSSPSGISINFYSLNPTTLTPDYSTSNTLRAGASSITLGLTDDNTKVGTLGATSFTLGVGNQSAQTTFTPLSPGTANIALTGQPAAGYTQPSSGNVTGQYVVSAATMTLGCDGTLGYNTVGNGCRVYLSAPAPPAGVSVTLTSSDATKVTLSNSQSSTGTKTQVVNIPGGSQYSSYAYPAALVGTGTVTVTASASGYNSATSSINLEPSGFVLQAGGNPVAGSSPSGISINFYSLNPTTLTPDYSTSNTLRAGASSITLGLTDDNTKVGTLGATSFTLGVGNQSAQTTFTPLSPGTANIALTGQPAAGYTQPSSGNVTGQYVVSAATMTLGCDGTLGYNTVGNGCRVYLSAPAPPAGVSVTLTSSDATKVTLSNSQSSTGTKTQVVNIPGGSQYSSYASYAYPAALVGTGTVTVTASASGYNSATSSINLEPSGFVLQAGGNPVAGSSPSGISINFYSLNPTTLTPDYSTSNTLRAGASSITLGLTDDNTKVGTLGATSFTLGVGNQSAQTTFTPLSPGTANIALTGQPAAGYTQPSSGNVTGQYVVSAATMTLGCDGTLGYNTVGNGCRVYLSAPAPPAGVSVTLTSSDATKVTLSNSQSSTGTKTQVVNIPGGSQYSSYASYAYPAALVGTGTVTVTASASGYNSATSSINLEPSGFVLQAGGNPVAGSSPSGISINFYSLNPTTLTPDYSTSNTLRAGASSITLGLTDDNTKVGTLGATSFTLGVGNQSAQTTFTPLSPGTANIALTGQPAAGYTQPSSGNVMGQYIVSAPANPTVSVGQIIVGQNMVASTDVGLSSGAPSDNFPVTVSVGSGSQLLLSTTGTDAGTTSLTFNLSQGQTATPSFYVYGIGSPGAVTVTLTATGYITGSNTITINPSGFAFQNSDFSTTLESPPTTLYIYPAVLDPLYGTAIQTGTLRPGMTNTQVTVTLTDQPSQGTGASKVGQITVNPVIFNGNDNPNQKITSFKPIGVGQTLLKLTSPGFSTSASEVTANVTQ